MYLPISCSLGLLATKRSVFEPALRKGYVLLCMYNRGKPASRLFGVVVGGCAEFERSYAARDDAFLSCRYKVLPVANILDVYRQLARNTLSIPFSAQQADTSGLSFKRTQEEQ